MLKLEEELDLFNRILYYYYIELLKSIDSFSKSEFKFLLISSKFEDLFLFNIYYSFNYLAC